MPARPTYPEVVEESIPERHFTEDFGVAQDDEAVARTCERHIQAAWVTQEPN
jgi:hypothetical protein